MIGQRSIIANLRHTLTLVLTFESFNVTNPLIFICNLEIMCTTIFHEFALYEGYRVFWVFVGLQLNFVQKIC